jgi:hypothetical protein
MVSEIIRNSGRSEEAATFKMADSSVVAKTISVNSYSSLGLCFQYLLDTSNPHYYPQINTNQ